MQEENTNNPEPEKVETVPNEAAGLPPTNDAGVGTLESVLRKIREAENVLVALSNSPSVDEIAAALGLTMVLDGNGKFATAIYSGKTPNVLEFLKPAETFESTTNSLQDFIIALNKDKADHLRYKIDGDFVKVYITPYKTTIGEKDLEFSRGDYNVDLVVALNVPAATELDAALKEHGRIMHDATSVNITNGAAGKFGDVEWVDANASSITEMVTRLCFEFADKVEPEAATALLTGLVAATDRFSNQATSSDVMMLAGKLMSAGADQQLVTANVQGEVRFDGAVAGEKGEALESEDKTELSISHDVKDEAEDGGDISAKTEEDDGVGMPGGGALAAQAAQMEAEQEQANMGANSGVVEQGVSGEQGGGEPLGDSSGNGGTESKENLEVKDATSALDEAKAEVASPNVIAGVEVMPTSGDANGYAGGALADQILGKLEKPEDKPEGATDYGKMIDEALAEPLPGEGGLQVGTTQGEADDGGLTGADGGMTAADGEVAQGSEMVGNSPDGGMGAPEGMGVPENDGMSEEDALNLIKQGQAEAMPGLDTGGETPRIIPSGGNMGYESPMMGQGIGGDMGMGMNPAMMQTPAVMGAPEMGSMPNMNYGGVQGGMQNSGQMEGQMGGMMGQGVPMQNGPLPMPGQGMMPQPMTPAPNFMPAEQIPQMPPVGGGMMEQQSMMQSPMGQGMAPQNPNDPAAFRIPGINS